MPVLHEQPSNASAAGECPDPEVVLSHLDSLPTLPAVAVKILQATSDQRSSAGDIVELLKADQSLTAKVLSAAGSAWVGARGPITTIDHAVPLLGFTVIRNLVLAVSVFECFPGERGPQGQAFNRTEFWKHALAVASASRGLALAQPGLRLDPQEAFVAGLLHDLGKVALSAIFPKAYERAARLARQSGGDIADFERAILGTDHTVVGRRLAERWKLPEAFQQVIWLHHLAADALPPTVRAVPLIAVVQLADTMAREQRLGQSGNYRFYEHSPEIAERLGFSLAQLEEVRAGLVQEVVEQARVLGLDDEPPETLYLRAMNEANAELGRLNTELTVTGRRLAAGARYFRAMARFDQLVGTSADLPSVVAAMARSASIALQRPNMAAFGLHAADAAVELAWVVVEQDQPGHRSLGTPTELSQWLAQATEYADLLVARAPAPLAALLEAVPTALRSGTVWLVPVVHEGKLVGGLLFGSEADERNRLKAEAEELKSFAASLGLALGRARTQASMQRMADDLAQATRRLQQMQAELVRSRTLSMIAEMAAGAGHELNSPLAVISGRAQMLAQSLTDAEAQRTLELIRSKAHECSQIVSELLEFARPRPPQLQVVRVPDLLNELRDDWLKRCGLSENAVRVERSCPAGPGRDPAAEIRADPEQLRAVFNELISNAVEALGGKPGVIRLMWGPAVNQAFVHLAVRDTGCGMPPAVLQRAFDPFFSHRQAGRGRGLGLARAYRIVESHGGRIWLESAPGEGTTAHLLLPKAPPLSPALEAHHAAVQATVAASAPSAR